MKRHQRDNTSTTAFVVYLKVWAAQGLRHPFLYARSVYRHTVSLLIPSVSLDFVTTIRSGDIETFAGHAAELGFDFTLDVERPEWVQDAPEQADVFFTETLAKLPVISLFCTQGFYGFWLPFAVCLLVVASKNVRSRHWRPSP